MHKLLYERRAKLTRSRDALLITKRGDDGGSVGGGDDSGDASRGVPGPPNGLMTFRDSATMSKGPCIWTRRATLVVIDLDAVHRRDGVNSGQFSDLRCRAGDFCSLPPSSAHTSLPPSCWPSLAPPGPDALQAHRVALRQPMVGHASLQAVRVRAGRRLASTVSTRGAASSRTRPCMR